MGVFHLVCRRWESRRVVAFRVLMESLPVACQTLISALLGLMPSWDWAEMRVKTDHIDGNVFPVCIPGCSI
jgi:hypothetical protein